MYTIVILITVGIAALICVTSAILSFYFSTHPASMQLQSDMEELTSVVSKLMKETRKEKMRNVRQGIKDNSEGSQISDQSQGGEIDLHSRGNSVNIDPRDKKSALRARLRNIRGG